MFRFEQDNLYKNIITCNISLGRCFYLGMFGTKFIALNCKISSANQRFEFGDKSQ